jgi:putative SOS response-associated peptidase YedK
VPHWSKTGATEKPLFNGRSETVLQTPTFKSAFSRGRCLLPASGWYKWSRTEEGTKHPYHLRLKEGSVLTFAGLFDVWRGEDEKPLVSCTVLTTAASDGLGWMHERMPVVLGYDDYNRWLDRSTPDIADLTELLVAYAEDELEVFPVSTMATRANAKGAGLIEAMGEPTCAAV